MGVLEEAVLELALQTILIFELLRLTGDGALVLLYLVLEELDFLVDLVLLALNLVVQLLELLLVLVLKIFDLFLEQTQL